MRAGPTQTSNRLPSRTIRLAVWIAARLSLLASLALVACGTSWAGVSPDRPRVSHYRMELRLQPRERSLRALTTMTIANTTGEAVTEIPFLLYRLFTVAAAENGAGGRLDWSQEVVIDRDEPTLQVNYVRVTLPRALAAGDSTRVTLAYGGPLFGYREVSGYIHDTVSEDYCLLREDSYAYPILARPSREGRAGIVDRPFTWELVATAPASYVVATGGEVLQVQAAGDSVRYAIRSRVPTWRLDIAAAKFARIADPPRGLAVYVLPGHDPGAARVLEGMRRVIAFYTRRFGDIGPTSYTAIEIPDGWGSQAGPLYLLQTAAAFTDSTRIGEVYHEIGHSWCATARPEVQRCRWFDEAFASYFEALAKGEFEGPEALRADMEVSRAVFRRWVDADSAYARIPIVDFGKHEAGGLSYTKGAWALHVLRELLGDDRFDRVIRELLREHRVKPAGFEDFRRIAERVGGRKLDRWYREWFLATESSRLLLEGASVEVMTARYR
jgi:hypothetical protein